MLDNHDMLQRSSQKPDNLALLAVSSSLGGPIVPAPARYNVAPDPPGGFAAFAATWAVAIQ